MIYIIHTDVQYVNRCCCCCALPFVVDVNVRGSLLGVVVICQHECTRTVAASSGVELDMILYTDGVRFTFKKGTTKQQMILNHCLVYTAVRT